MNILVSGVAGFIGFHLSKLLLEKGFNVIGIDNINDYYDPNLKLDRLKILGINLKKGHVYNKKYQINNFKFLKLNLEDKVNLLKLFEKEKIDIVCNLAAQAGVRYSLTNPDTYIQSNIVGFHNILEACRLNNVKHLIYASSSSVYGLNKKIPFTEDDNVDNPISLYAATKKSNELMAHTYSHLYNIPTTGIRFFTVYGPWGRPDMALFIFTKSIIEDKKIDVYNFGKMLRDFTYIDDVISGLFKIITEKKNNKFSIYNMGNNNPIELLEFISCIEKKLGKHGKKNLIPIQSGDVLKTWANVDKLIKDYDYKPSTKIEYGIDKFINWYLKYYKIEN